MAKINCSAKNCLYNNEKFCSRNQIAVERKTSCDSFEYMDKNYNVEIADFSLNDNKDIWCDAVKCKYQETGKCYAKEIKVGNPKASSSVETNCQTFEEK